MMGVRDDDTREVRWSWRKSQTTSLTKPYTRLMNTYWGKQARW